uniref:ribosomal protein L24 n=1 Tax=Chattonella marina TaxID=90936 RepID=UPI0021145320|nr:ribosomal protein L24 [Chattonella marina]UTE94780.1 ribosomal protein L24 [Chattonella marina]
MKKNFKYKKQSIKIGDFVEIIAGNEKTKQGKVKAVLKKDQKIIVEGINTRFRHIKPQRQGETGKIKQFEAPIHISNVKKITN